MKRTALISFAFLLAMETLAAAQYPEWLGQVQIVPPNPTSSDVVSITLSGEWYDSCIPNDSAISLMANDIYFDVIHDYPPTTGCFPFCCPGWQQTQAVGSLPEGTYTVYARFVSWFPFPPWWRVYVPVAEFTVRVPTYYYVDCVDGNDLNDGLSPETAFETIQKGINTALDSDTVIIGEGVYTGAGNRELDFGGRAISVQSENPNNWDVVAATIIDCQYGGRGFHFHSGETASSVLAGLTITKGYADHGGGVYCQGSSPTIRNCKFSSNMADYGGGMENQNCSPAVTECMFVGNGVFYYGGGMYNSGCTLAVSNCIFAGNSAMWGAGMENFSCAGSIINCTFTGNSAELGGGMDNSSSSGLSVSNCIFRGDTASMGPEIYGAVSVSYCDVQGGYAGTGNIDADPCFADPCNGDYHLQSAAGHWDSNSQTWLTDVNTSYCIDAGNPGCPPANEPAPNGNRINMGAHGGTAEASKSPASWALLADLTNDHRMDFNDLNVFVSYWLETGENIPSDLDRSQFVDFGDFGIFADQWSNAYMPEAGMGYQIGDCEQGESVSLIAEESGQTRFTVTVDGRYIHFEDMMVANCCPDELELQMTAEGNLIAIHEIEHISMPCRCSCDYPVTATLGPFDPGAYTLEVYQDVYYEGSLDGTYFVGSTTVTID